MADPGPIAATLEVDSAIARHYRLGGIVTVVDAIHGVVHLARFEEARRQVAVADAIVVSKLDLVEMPRDLEARLASLNPHARRAGGAASDLFPDHAAARSLPSASHEHAGHDHLAEQGIATRVVRLTAPLAWSRYAAWVQWMRDTLGARLLRMKGVVRMADGEVRALHAVMQLFSAPHPMTTMPVDFGHGIVVLIAQDVPPMCSTKRAGD